MKRLLLLLILILVIAGCLFFKFSDLNVFDIFKSQPVVIDKTANIVEKVRQLAELTTFCYYEDNVIVKKRLRKETMFGWIWSFWGFSFTFEDELVLITRGKIRVGFDLSKIQESDIIIDSLSITLRLPKVQILDVITNPSDFETFEESGKWSHDEVTGYKNEIRAIIEKNARDNGIFELAENSAKERLTLLLQIFGFDNVVILFGNERR
jgi:hypothetical protein